MVGPQPWESIYIEGKKRNQKPPTSLLIDPETVPETKTQLLIYRTWATCGHTDAENIIDVAKWRSDPRIYVDN